MTFVTRRDRSVEGVAVVDQCGDRILIRAAKELFSILPETEERA